MSEFINTIELLGDRATFDAIMEDTLEEFRDNMLDVLSSYAFAGCKTLKHVNLPNLSLINDAAFQYCSALKSLILPSETMCTLKLWVFEQSSIANGTGYIYVPRALLSDEDATKDYRRATNWATYANQFRALEDYTVDGTVTGELDESKI